jgi:hypothetical protein
MFSKTTALPLFLNNDKEAADGFTTAPLGAKFPLTTASPESTEHRVPRLPELSELSVQATGLHV